MSYIEGFVIPVPTARKDDFIAHALACDAVIVEQGAQRVIECWGDNVPRGKQTDFYGAVGAKPEETTAFSWIEWPDKATRTRVHSEMGEMMKSDDRINPEKNPMPFDGQRMIFGGFEPIVEQGSHSPDNYVQGFLIPVPAAKREAYRKMAEEVWPMFQEYGALRVVECWDDDVPEGKVTDFRRAVKAETDEKVVFSFMEWPSREVCDKAHDAMMKDERMQPDMEMPFDGKRMIFGGFVPVVTMGH